MRLPPPSGGFELDEAAAASLGHCSVPSAQLALNP